MALVIEGLETEDEWQSFRDRIVDDLAPEGALEHELARTIATYLWRKRRVPFYENAILNRQVQETESNLAMAEAYRAGTLSDGVYPDLKPNYVEAAQHTRTLPFEEDAAKITRYESHLHRLFLQTLHELEAIQIRRKGGQSPLARLDINGPPAAQWTNTPK